MTVPTTATAGIAPEDKPDRIRREPDDGSFQTRLAAVEKLDNRRDKRALDILLDVAGTWT